MRETHSSIINATGSACKLYAVKVRALRRRGDVKQEGREGAGEKTKGVEMESDAGKR